MRRIRPRHYVLALSIPFVIYAVLGGFLGHAVARDSAYRYLSVFQDVVTLIINNYVEPVGMNAVMEGAIRGMMDALDPDSCYLSPEELANYRNPTKRDLAGIGVEVTKRYYLQVAAVLPGSPAEKAGIKPGDLLKSVDGQNTREMNVIVGEALLKGDPGSSVNLQVISGRQPEPVEVAVEREPYAKPPLVSRMLDAQTGYLRIASFRTGVAEEAARLIEALKRQGAERLVVDVRDSFGREAEEGARVAELFVSGGIAAKLEGRAGKPTLLRLAGDRTVFSGPLVVLINGGSSGSAEILAGAIGDAGRAELVGVKSSGRAAVQKLIPLDDGSGLVLSVSQYWTPNGKPLLGEGIEPSVAVEEPEAEEEGDPILEKGLEILAREAVRAKAAA